MPSRLRPTAPLAPDAILVGDPGRALLLAQELLEQPKMSNHARGLWGYSGQTPGGEELTIQATGIGAPSAVAVLTDLAELGVRRAVRVGTCAGLDTETHLGELLLVNEAVAAGGSAISFGVPAGAAVSPDPALLEQMQKTLGAEAREARVGSFDAMPADAAAVGGGIVATDMQSAAVLALARELGVAAAAVLIVAEAPGAVAGESESIEIAAKRAGRAAAAALST